MTRWGLTALLGRTSAADRVINGTLIVMPGQRDDGKATSTVGMSSFRGGKIADICTAIGLRAALVAAAMQTDERCFADKSADKRAVVELFLGAVGQENRPRLLFSFIFSFFLWIFTFE